MVVKYKLGEVAKDFNKSAKDIAFKKYLGDGCPCYIPKERITPEYAINLIKNSGGKAILAHPLLYNFSNVTL